MIKIRALPLKASSKRVFDLKNKCLFSTGFNAQIDYYDILGIKKGASEEEVRNGFRLKVKEFHPDINPSYQDKFKLINQAYSILSNQNLKRQYIKMREAYQSSQQNTYKYNSKTQKQQSDIFDEAINNTLKYMKIKSKQKVNTHISRFGTNSSPEDQKKQMQQEQKRQKLNENMPKLILGFSGLLTTLIIIQMIVKYNVKKKYPDLI